MYPVMEYRYMSPAAYESIGQEKRRQMEQVSQAHTWFQPLLSKQMSNITPSMGTQYSMRLSFYQGSAKKLLAVLQHLAYTFSSCF